MGPEDSSLSSSGESPSQEKDDLNTTGPTEPFPPFATIISEMAPLEQHETDITDHDFCDGCGLRTDGRHGTCDCFSTPIEDGFLSPELPLSNTSSEIDSLLYDDADDSDCSDEKTYSLPTGSLPTRRQSFLEMLHEATSALVTPELDDTVDYEYDKPDPMDPNLFTDDGDEVLNSDEDEEICCEKNSDSSDSESDTNEQDIFFDCDITSLYQRVENSSDIYGEAQLRAMTINGWDVAAENTVIDVEAEANDIDRMYNGYHGPSAGVLPHARTPLDIFYYFMPKHLWIHIAGETNRYWRQTFDNRVDEEIQRMIKEKKPYNRHQIESKLNNFRPILPHEIVQWIGMMIARVLCPKKQLHSHWAKHEKGCVPSGTFGKIMARQRFMDISRFLHFSNNENPEAKRDRAWKIRPVLQTIEKTFKAGYVLGAYIALDEAMLPSRNRHNPTRTYMKDKPHKWGTKCVMTCCALSGYCKR